MLDNLMMTTHKRTLVNGRTQYIGLVEYPVSKRIAAWVLNENRNRVAQVAEFVSAEQAIAVLKLR